VSGSVYFYFQIQVYNGAGVLKLTKEVVNKLKWFSKGDMNCPLQGWDDPWVITFGTPISSILVKIQYSIVHI